MHSPTRRAERVKLLVDTDIGSEIDDALALAYLLCNPACEVLGISTVTGEAEARAMLASALCRAAGQSGIPICPGRERTITGDSLQRQASQRGALASLDYQAVFPQRDPVAFFRQALSENDGEVVLLTLGPLTHVAELFESDAQIPKRLRRLVTMGGYFCGHQAEGGEPTVEWNIRLDPEAADVVFRTAIAGGHYIVGLETTRGLHLPETALAGLENSAVLQAVRQLHRCQSRVDKPLTTYDLIAAVLALSPELAESERGVASVSLSEPLRRGATNWQPDSRSGRQRLFTSILPTLIFQEFLSVFDPQGDVTACEWAS